MEHTVCPILIDGVSRKNNWDETAVNYKGKDLDQNCLSQLEGGGMGRGHRVQVEEQAVEGKDPNWRPVVSM